MPDKNININTEQILPVVKYGDPILRKKVHKVDNFSNLNTIINQMYKTMYNENGIGLAANQVGLNLNILILSIPLEGDDENRVQFEFINAKITDSSGESIMEEGCLSVPEIRAEIKRPESITLKYQSRDERYHESTFTGIESRVIQHEMDHLNGKLFIDYLPQSKKMLINKRLIEISKLGAPSTGIIL